MLSLLKISRFFSFTQHQPRLHDDAMAAAPALSGAAVTTSPSHCSLSDAYQAERLRLLNRRNLHRGSRRLFVYHKTLTFSEA